jgi:hypothetical protein
VIWQLSQRSTLLEAAHACRARTADAVYNCAPCERVSKGALVITVLSKEHHYYVMDMIEVISTSQLISALDSQVCTDSTFCFSVSLLLLLEMAEQADHC